MKMNKETPQQFIDWWEDRHPLVRRVMEVMVLSVLVSVILGTVIQVGVRILNFGDYFRIAMLESIWYLLHAVIGVLLAYYFVKGIWLLAKDRINTSSFAIISLAPLLLLIIFRMMPTFFETAVSYRMNRSYSAIYGDLTALCEEWDILYGQVEIVSFRPEEQPLGVFAEADVEVWREGNTVFFNMGDAVYNYGFACALGDEPPKTDGRRSDEFRYQHIGSIYYEFYPKSN